GCDEAIEVVVARPPAARDADEPAARELPDVDAGRLEPRDGVRGLVVWAEADEGRPVGRRHDLEAPRQQLAAPLGRLPRTLEAPRGAQRKRCEHRPERALRPPAGL